LTFADWYKFSFLEGLTYEMNVCFQEKFLTNNALGVIGGPASRAQMFGWAIVL
jgi:hypothetical protein